MNCVKIWIAFCICLFFSACSMQESSVDSNEKNSGAAIQGSSGTVISKSVSPSQQPDTSYIEKENVTIQGKTYSYIRYAYELGKVRIICLRSKEDELVFPSEIDSHQVYLIGGYQLEDEIPADLHSDKLGEMALAWQESKAEPYQRIVIPEGVKRIIDFAFQGVRADEVQLPSSMYEIGKFSFMHSQVYKVTVKNPEMKISRMAFADSKIKELELSENFGGKVETLSFQNSRLQSFTWPVPCKKEMVGRAAFSYCKNLKEIRFPENQSLIYIPEYSFLGCESLEELVFPASTGKVRYTSQPYADNFTQGGAGTLRFLGKDTELDACSYIREYTGKHFVTAGRIVGPKDSKVIRYAKYSMKMKSMSEKLQKEVFRSFLREEEPVEYNFSSPKLEKEITMAPMDYKETE